MTIKEFTKQNFKSLNDNAKEALLLINYPSHALIMHGFDKVQVGRPDFQKCIQEKDVLIVVEEHLSDINNYSYFREGTNSARQTYYRISDGETTIPAGYSFFPGDIIMSQKEEQGTVSYWLLRKPYWFIKNPNTGVITGPFTTEEEASRHMENEYMDWESIVFDENSMTGETLKDFLNKKPIR